MLARRFSRVVRLGLWSTARVTESPSTANTTGTRCGRPAASAVARWATRAAANRSRAWVLVRSGTAPRPVGPRRSAVLAGELGEPVQVRVRLLLGHGGQVEQHPFHAQA